MVAFQWVFVPFGSIVFERVVCCTTGSVMDFTNEFVVILILRFVVGFVVILIEGFMDDLSVLGFWTGFSVGLCHF